MITKYNFTTDVGAFPAETFAWLFLMLPDDILCDPKFQDKLKERASKFQKVSITVENSTNQKYIWETSLLPHDKLIYFVEDTKGVRKKVKISRLFIPLRKEVRKNITLEIGDMVNVTIELLKQ
jgi:hypothetical protein